jgi:hypothetical protein
MRFQTDCPVQYTFYFTNEYVKREIRLIMCILFEMSNFTSIRYQ